MTHSHDALVARLAQAGCRRLEEPLWVTRFYLQPFNYVRVPFILAFGEVCLQTDDLRDGYPDDYGSRHVLAGRGCLIDRLTALAEVPVVPQVLALASERRVFLNSEVEIFGQFLEDWEDTLGWWQRETIEHPPGRLRRIPCWNDVIRTWEFGVDGYEAHYEDEPDEPLPTHLMRVSADGAQDMNVC